MANNTLILQIVVDFVSKVSIFKLFSRFWRGSFCLKKFPSSKKSQVQKSPKSGRGWGGHRHLGTFPKFRRFLILKAPLTSYEDFVYHPCHSSFSGCCHPGDKSPHHTFRKCVALVSRTEYSVFRPSVVL